MSNLVDRLNNEHPNYSDAIAAADKIQELQIDLNILKKGYHLMVKERDQLHAEVERLKQLPIANVRQTGWAAPKDRYAVPVLFNPYTGEPRDVRDVQSDPQGILIAPIGEVLMQSAPKQEQAEPVVEDLAMMVRRLVLIARKHIDDPHKDLTFANDCLKRLQQKGLAGSPLRDLEQFEYIDIQNHRLTKALQSIMLMLTRFLDEDQFGIIEQIVIQAGVTPPDQIDALEQHLGEA